MKNKLILVIEDNALNMKLIKSLLQLGDYDVAEASDAESGIELAKKQKPDLILMDIQLPGMNGLHATQIISKDPELREIPVVAITSYAMHGDEQKARLAGCIGYITKPINTRNFLEVLEGYLEPAEPLEQQA